jgi:hypothetical protein
MKYAALMLAVALGLADARVVLDKSPVSMADQINAMHTTWTVGILLQY